jgi:hypothetical protein
MRFLGAATFIFLLGCVVSVFPENHSSDRAAAQTPSRNRSPAPQGATGAPVVVELFTSEGCSSCPPADALLSTLETAQSIEGAEILALEEHVDYWNQQGWVDPFSAAEFTERQQRYAEAFAHGSAYTPQMVVDGRYEFVGSRSAEAMKTIAASAAQTRAGVTVLGSGLASSGREQWSIFVDKLDAASSEPAEVWLAVTETHLHTKVGAGENAGHDLPHAAVVRQLTKIAAVDGRKQQTFSAAPSISFSPHWKKENLRVVVFIQEKKSRRIVGAASAKVNP